MISKITLRRYILALMLTLTLFALLAGTYRINLAAQAAMSESAVPLPEISGDGALEYVFSGYGMSCLRSAVGKVCPYIALVVELILWVFFSLVGLCA